MAGLSMKLLVGTLFVKMKNRSLAQFFCLGSRRGILRVKTRLKY